MNVLLIGSGGRESAFAWKLSQSPLMKKLYITPGNGGTAQYGKNVDIDIYDINNLIEFITSKNISMVIVGPEAPLVGGIYDMIKELLPQIMIIGPSRNGAMLEGSKSFAKKFMKEFNIPTAEYGLFTLETQKEAFEFIDQMTLPIVLKADGLAAGKGVSILDSKEEAKKEFLELVEGRFGESSKKVVIEQFLNGVEYSVFVVTDGKKFKMLPIAKDYKRIGEGNTGKNTGGMGAVSPVSFINDELMINTVLKVIQPTVAGLWQKNIDYKGFIYFGLINVNNEPYVIEYNCRMGDPETQVVLPRLKNDLLELLISVYRGDLEKQTIFHAPEASVGVVVASGGYPDSYEKGFEIENMEDIKDSIVFHNGTEKTESGYKTNGGRVLTITSFGKTKQEALEKSLKAAKKIKFKNKYFRTDIGFDS
ncbi:MAG: phosphoribosylamine--glycine ligase [Saprospiraceae bacterium]